MPGRDIIVIGASAGGVEALTRLVRDLPEDLPAAIFVVLHLPAYGNSALPAILSRKGKLRARHPEDHEQIEHGQTYVAPPNRHLLIRNGHIRLGTGPRENGVRPAVDPLFRTAALEYGPRVIGVVLSGGLDDGTAGLIHIKERGGVAIAQEPTDALFPSMPTSAIKNAGVDYVLPLSKMAATLDLLAREHVEVIESASERQGGLEMPDRTEIGMDALDTAELPGPPSALTCPECGGAIWILENGELVRMRCHVGHSYSVESFASEQTETLERALWTAVRALEEKSELMKRLVDNAARRGHDLVSRRFMHQVHEAEAGADLIRGVILNNQFGSTVETRFDDAGLSTAPAAE